MEKDLLLYLMYKALILIRARSSKEKDRINFELSNILHNVPLQLIAGESNQEVYNKLLQHAKGGFIEEWITSVQEEFFKDHPEYKNSN